MATHYFLFIVANSDEDSDVKTREICGGTSRQFNPACPEQVTKTNICAILIHAYSLLPYFPQQLYNTVHLT